MASVSSKEIKTRIRSMQSTRQITKAMEMVAASKLRRAQSQVLASRPYFQTLYDAVSQIAASSENVDSAYLAARPVKKTAWIVIAGDRGLAGGYNSNVLKMAWPQIAETESCVLPIGKKAMDFFRSRKCQILSEQYGEAEDVSVGDCFSIAKLLCKAYREGSIDRVCIAYTNFVSVLSQVPGSLTLLPLQRPRSRSAGTGDVVYEPDSATVLDAIIPEYVGGILYGALCESRASEQAARRTAMDAATKNAGEMIDQLSLQYNRARQAAITQEITEIVAGS